MLDSLQADEIQLTDEGISARTGPVAFSLECSARDADRLVETAETEQTKVLCRVEMKDERPVLVGFATENRRKIYDTVRAISGLGRRTALKVLDCGEAIDILRAASAGDAAFFRQVPGLGQKKVETLLDSIQGRYRGALPKPVPMPVADFVTARDALVASGRSLKEAELEIVTAAQGLDSPDAQSVLDKLVV